MMPVLIKLFIAILVTGHFPSAWNVCLLGPCFKKGDPADSSNYRGIILFESAVSKVVKDVEQRVAGLNTGRVAVFAFLGKMLNFDCLSPLQCINDYPFWACVSA